VFRECTAQRPEICSPEAAVSRAQIDTMNL
jgi:hypothetical protein